MDKRNEISELKELAVEAKKNLDHQNAYDCYVKLSVAQPNNSIFSIECAEQLIALRRFDEARVLLHECLENKMHLGRIWNLLGRIELQKNQIDLALVCFKRGVELDPKFPQNYLSAVNQLIHDLDWDNAQSIIDMGLKNLEKPFWLEIQELAILKRCGLLDEAIDKAEKLRDKYPGDFNVELSFADLLLKSGDLDAAQEILRIVNPVNSAHILRLKMVKARLAFMYYELSEAIGILNELLNINPRAIEALNLMVTINLMECDLDLAKKNLNQLVNLRTQLNQNPEMPKFKGGLHYMRLQEYSTNPFALKRLGEIRHMPPTEKTLHIARLVEEEPFHLGSSIALLTALRQANFFRSFDHPVVSLIECPIPQNIIQYWDTKDIPGDIFSFMESTKTLNSSFKHLIFDSISAGEFIGRNCDPLVLQAYLTANHPAMRADIFRLAYICVNGGLYIDADDRCRRPLESLLVHGNKLILVQEVDGSIGNNFIAAIPNHPFMTYALETVVDYVNRRQGDNVWLVSGPGALTASFVRWALPALLQQKLPKGVSIIPQHSIERYVSMHLSAQYKKNGSHWSSGHTASRSIFKIPRRT